MMFSSQTAMRPLPSRFPLLLPRLLFLSSAGALLWIALVTTENNSEAPRASLLPQGTPTPTQGPPTQKTPTLQGVGLATPLSPSAVLPAPLPKTTPIPALPVAQDKMIRVGLCTKGGAIQLWSRQPLVIRDTAQPGLAMVVKATDKITLVKSTLKKKPVPGKPGAFYSGVLEIRTSTGTSSGWQSAFVYAAPVTKDEFIRLTSDGANAQWGRPYRGHIEITPQTKAFDASHYKGALRVVNVVEMEEYLKGVVPWEMTPGAPLEALKAQAICARSELLAKAQSKRFHPYGFDVTDYDNCQGYPGAENEKPSTTLAVEQTKGMVLYYKGRIADAVYGTNSGGLTASDEDVWKGGAAPYLRGVRDYSPALHSTMARVVKAKMSEDDWAAYCSQNLPAYAQPNTAERRQLASRRATSRRVAQLFQENDLPEFYRWSRFISAEEMAKAMATQFKVKMALATEIRVLERASSGHIKRLAISGQQSVVSAPKSVDKEQTAGSVEKPTTAVRPLTTVVLQGDSQIRSMLTGRMGSTTALPSSTFVALPQKDATGAVVGWIVNGAGWGHGVGMCQRGAQNHALQGWDYKRILQHYFTGIEIKKLKTTL